MKAGHDPPGDSLQSVVSLEEPCALDLPDTYLSIDLFDYILPLPAVDLRIATDFSARLAGINVGAPARPLPSADFGLIGLAVMGQNLILNAADHGFTVCAYNRTTSKVDRFLDNEAKGEPQTCESPARRILTDKKLINTSFCRQAHRWCSLRRGVLRQAQASPSYHALGHGWQARRPVHRVPPASP